MDGCCSDEVEQGLRDSAARVVWGAGDGRHILMANFRGLKDDAQLLPAMNRMLLALRLAPGGVHLVVDVRGMRAGPAAVEHHRANVRLVASRLTRLAIISPGLNVQAQRALASIGRYLPVGGAAICASPRAAGCSVCSRGLSCPFLQPSAAPVHRAGSATASLAS